MPIVFWDEISNMLPRVFPFICHFCSGRVTGNLQTIAGHFARCAAIQRRIEQRIEAACAVWVASMDGALKANTGVSSGGILNSDEVLRNIWKVVTSFFINLMMSSKVLHHDEIPDLQETHSQIVIAIPIAADPHNAESSGFNSNSELLLPCTLKVALAVRSFLFMLLCLIIPYDRELDLGNVGRTKKLLSQVVMSLCCAWAVALPFSPEETRLKNRLLLNLLCITLSLAFSSVFVANMISDRSPVTAHAFLVTGILCGVTAFFMTLSIPLSLPFACAIWFIFVTTITVVVVVRL